MKKTCLVTAILLLSAVWVMAQTSPSSPQTTTPSASSPQSTSPSSASPSQQPATPDATTTQTTTTQTTQTSTDSANSIEGCLSGSAGSWSLTDQSGKTWQLAGDTSKLSDHVGHQVRVTGTDNSGSASSSGSMGGSNASGGATGAGSTSGSQSTFNVKKVKMISSTCSTTSK